MTQTTLRSDAEQLASGQAPLLVRALHLASTVVWGPHGRRRSGQGEAFWQYRPAHAGDGQRNIDWRRSARADDAFVRETEWQIAQSLQIWVDPSEAMGFTSSQDTKADRAKVLAMALAALAIRGGEKVGATTLSIPPKPGTPQLDRLAQFWAMQGAQEDYGHPDPTGLRKGAQAVLLSDFLGDLAAVEHFLATASRQTVQGALVMVLDPQELAFPFQGRTIFQSMGGNLRYETQQAGALAQDYRSALANRQTQLKRLADHAGWQFHVHVTNTPARDALLWLAQALGPLR